MSSARRWAVWGGEEVFELRASMMDVRRNCSGGGRSLDGGVMPRVAVSVGSVGVVMGDFSNRKTCPPSCWRGL